ncbi:MAG: amidohydrolase family protein [Bacteroidota bacterium]
MKVLLLCLLTLNLLGQTSTRSLLKADRVFDGEAMHTGWSILVNGNVIEAVGELKSIPAGTTIISLPGTTLMPGMIEGHSHLFLHPYNETSWDDQVLNESRTERTARAINHAKATLMAGFTTVRDLGTEGAMYDDAALKSVIEKGIVPGPRMIAATRAIVAKGTYGPRKGNPDIDFPQGAAEVGNLSELINEVRIQIGKGADVVKIYADYRWGLKKEEAPTFTVEEIAAAVAVAKSGGRQVVAHASSVEGMRRAILGGVSVIEHGDNGTAEIFALMKEKTVALCPTISAGEAVATYRAEKKGGVIDSSDIRDKMRAMNLALKAGVTICMGGDVGVYTHGDNARELIAMKKYGMSAIAVLQSATSVNARVFGMGDKIGKLQAGMLADIIGVAGDPIANIEVTKQVKFVMKDGVVYKTDMQ